MSDYIALERRYGATNYAPLPIVLTRGEGVWLWDDQDRRYLDMLSAYSAVSFGYGHPKLVQVFTEQAKRLAVTSRAFHSNTLPPFLARLCEITGMDRALPMTTGAEGVETAIKCARKWAYIVKKVPRDKAEIIVCEANFHGRTSTIVGFSSEAQYRDDFGPYAKGAFPAVPFGDAKALAAAITPNTAAFLVEPVQGEAGIIVPPEGYLTECARICRENNVLLIVDEVQTGLGRTGKVLAIQHEGVKPDGLILGKALGGGLMPVSAFLAREDVMGVFKPGDHGSTFGGNALGAAIGLASLNVLMEEKLADRAAAMGDYLLARLKTIASPVVTDVRGKGLLVGIELDPAKVSARAFVETLLKHGVLSKDTHGTVARFAPALIIERQEIDWALERIRAALREYGPVYERAA
ncbi:ornithine--oxo-acid transaminase [Usitatibacter palustris]|uniref:ornithine aminotransferase n=1 Tax=Usitatibacter palustris TaxID=2732487 RepID=A0A6M4H6N0_9PROT|nr:ornithine--oxo-acid transaminase [Usitatibacter palustris]QJR15180.1 Ornithine aminotransferase [Usitatibacter palustris]